MSYREPHAVLTELRKHIGQSQSAAVVKPRTRISSVSLRTITPAPRNAMPVISPWMVRLIASQSGLVAILGGMYMARSLDSLVGSLSCVSSRASTTASQFLANP
jgi:hypothetical protein